MNTSEYRPSRNRYTDNVVFLNIDVTNPGDIEETICKSTECISKEGLNLLINNAGIAYKKQYLGNINKQDLTEQFEVNVFGPILITQVTALVV
jgi:NAD(P)-dependent dehydrogenase (short-subunit alcohol dehydrogenase family)